VDYDQLKNYIEKKMVMQHIYQPVMLKILLESKEYRASAEDIARQFLVNDEPQLQYYKYITKVVLDRVLRSHGIVTAEDDEFVLNLRVKLTPEQAWDI
jgi:ATP adenylyltransferase